MKKQAEGRKYLLLLLFPLAILINYLSSKQIQVTEESYSQGAYIAIAPILSRITGLYPYSLAEIVTVLLFAVLIWRLVAFFRSLAGKQHGKLALLRYKLIHLVVIIGIIYFSFIIMWGLNYNRSSIATITGLEVRPASVAELAQLTNSLIQEVNQLRILTEEDNSGVMHTPGGYKDVLRRGPLGYEVIAAEIPQLGGSYGAPKPVTLSKPWAYTGIWGVYFPFTAEANINIAIPAPYLPFTTAHEMAHQRGFAREDETNYIAYLVCRAHPDVDYRYSGNLMALVHSLRALAQVDSSLQRELAGKLTKGVRRDLQSLEEFNRRHESPFERFTLKVNDLYLKANNQKDGDRSYGRVVDLLIAEFRTQLKKGEGM